MNIKTLFSTSLHSYPRIPSGLNPEVFLGNILETKEGPDAPLICLYAISRTKASFPWSFDFRSLDCHLLLYTIRGCGKLTAEGQVSSLSESTLLLLDCRRRFRLDLITEPWEYQMMLIGGANVSYYHKQMPGASASVIPVRPYSDMAGVLELLMEKSRSSAPESVFLISDYLNHLLTCFLTEWVKEPAPRPFVPAYITDMKLLFDENFKEEYSLDRLEALLGVSKYRLCREFKQHIGVSPIQYLNRKRIDYSACLLLTTSARIHEVGSMVGIDNTNHFIFLFKKYYGVTPAEYRQRMRL